jgi:hypothetical protein
MQSGAPKSVRLFETKIFPLLQFHASERVGAENTEPSAQTGDEGGVARKRRRASVPRRRPGSAYEADEEVDPESPLWSEEEEDEEEDEEEEEEEEEEEVAERQRPVTATRGGRSRAPALRRGLVGQPAEQPTKPASRSQVGVPQSWAPQSSPSAMRLNCLMLAHVAAGREEGVSSAPCGRKWGPEGGCVPGWRRWRWRWGGVGRWVVRARRRGRGVL